MRVKVTQLAFYDGARRRPGDVISVPEGKKAKWFTPVEEPAPKTGKGKVVKAAEPEQENGSEFV